MQVLILILKVLLHDSHLLHDLLVATLFPFEEGFLERLLVEVDESQFRAVHSMLVVFAVFSPSLEESEHDVLMSLHEISEKLSLIFLV